MRALVRHRTQLRYRKQFMPHIWSSEQGPAWSLTCAALEFSRLPDAQSTEARPISGPLLVLSSARSWAIYCQALVALAEYPAKPVPVRLARQGSRYSDDTMCP